MAIRVPILTPDQIPLEAPARPSYGSTEGPAIEARGQQALAQGQEHVAGSVEHLALVAGDAKIQWDQAEVMASVNALGDWKVKNLDGKALQTKGKSALGVTDTALAEYDKAVQKANGTLTGGYQQRLFLQHAAADRNVVQRQLIDHEHRELEKQKSIDFSSGLDRYVSEAGLRWKVPGAPENALAFGEKAIADFGTAEHWGEEQIGKALRDYRSRVVASVVSNAVAVPEEMGSAYAREFLRRHAELSTDAQGNLVPDTKGLVDGEVVHKLWNSVREADIRDTARQETARILAKTPPNAQGIVDLAAQEALARGTVKNAQVLAEVQSQLHQIWNIGNANRAQRDTQLAHSMILGLDEDALKQKPLSVNKADPRWQQMTDTGRATVEEHLISLQRTERSERQRLIEEARYSIMARPPTERARINVATEYPYLDKVGVDAIQHYVLQAQTEVAKDNAISAEGAHASMKAAAEKMGYSKRTTGEFIAAIEDRLAKEFPDKTRPAQKGDVDKVIADELLRGDSGTWSFTRAKWEAEKKQIKDWKPYGPDRQTFEPSKGLAPTTPGAAPGAPAPRASSPMQIRPLPDPVRQRIITTLQKKGMPATEQNIIDVWVQQPQSRVTP